MAHSQSFEYTGKYFSLEMWVYIPENINMTIYEGKIKVFNFTISIQANSTFNKLKIALEEQGKTIIH